MRLFSLFFGHEPSGEVKQAQQKLDSSVRNVQNVDETKKRIRKAFNSFKKSLEAADLAMRSRDSDDDGRTS